MDKQEGLGSVMASPNRAMWRGTFPESQFRHHDYVPSRTRPQELPRGVYAADTEIDLSKEGGWWPGSDVRLKMIRC